MSVEMIVSGGESGCEPQDSRVQTGPFIDEQKVKLKAEEDILS